MKFSKKGLRLAGALLGTMLMGSVFAGCGGGGDDAKSDEIKIGANFEMTGNVANYGNATLEGLKLAIKEANDAGGVNGKKIKLVEVDNKSEASESVNAATKLISDDKVKLIVGPAVTANVIAESQVATDNKVPILAPDATSPAVTVENGKVKDFVFRSCFIDPQQGDVMAKFAIENLKAKTAVIYIDNSSDYSKSLGQVFKEKFEAAGGKVVMEEAFLQKDQDFKAALTKIKTANADVIFIPAYYEEVGKIVKQARELGITQPLLGTDGWDDFKVADIAGADALNNTFFSTHYSDKDESVKAFIDAYTKEYNHAPNVFAALGYDAGKLLVDAIKRAGSDDTVKIKDALAATKDLQVGTGIITMDKNHNPIKQAVILENKGGDRVMVAKIMPEAE
ncbi:MAG: ABC transporter substrate-binding protein [Selenomonadaceae bacterium]|nr:ABC transporter substrate-binding protein [Selenomonadaceae bacterium]MBQ1511162.1 ABC transporter substrate-binding protein [Selenomonadaceae bacterium]MBQ1914754.1 ABC transporter substrate-binding protein [Selenomonadaceae bacterium]MBQ3971634.1 ABC transporter substrate-binding protein [Selenomonadaceae bacterium]